MIVLLILFLFIVRCILDGAGYKSGKNYRLVRGKRRFK